MCGFILAPEHLVKSPAVAMSAIRHRGADGFEGYEYTGGWFLGHSRLAVATTGQEGYQPFKDRHGRSLAFVGEVFDGPLINAGSFGDRHIEFDEIEKAMSSHWFGGFHFLDGFWSVARVDPYMGKAVVVTDHLGIKPVYYWPEHKIVCSEITPMFELADRPELDEMYLANCIKFGYDASGRTPWKGVRQMPRGSFLELNLWGSELFPHPNSIPLHYWDWDKVPEVDNLPEAMTSAVVSRYTQSRYPVGLLYSGGLDSSIIRAVLKAEDLLWSTEVFTIPEDGKDYHEAVHLAPCPSYSDEELTEVLREMQCPVDLGSLIPQHHLAKQLQSHNCRATLTGDGADELFGGYRRQWKYDAQESDMFGELPYYHLPRLDRIMMAHGIEVRSPFLSPRIAAYALKLPYEERIDKKHLREAFKHLLPKGVADTPKQPLKSPEVLSGAPEHRLRLDRLFRELERTTHDKI